MFDWLEMLHRTDPIPLRRPHAPDPSLNFQSPRKKPRISSSPPDSSPTVTDERLIRREILLQKAQIPALRERLAELQPLITSDTPDLDYDGRLLRIVSANREKQTLDSQFAELRGHYTDAYCCGLSKEIVSCRASLKRIQVAIKKLNDTMAFRKAQLEMIQNQELTVTISNQQDKILILQNQLQELTEDQRGFHTKCHQLRNEDPEVMALEQQLNEIQTRALNIAQKKAERSRRLDRLILDLDSKRKVLRFLDQPSHSPTRSKARRRMGFEMEGRIARPSPVKKSATRHFQLDLLGEEEKRIRLDDGDLRIKIDPGKEFAHSCPDLDFHRIENEEEEGLKG